MFGFPGVDAGTGAFLQAFRCGMLSVKQFSSPDADTPLGGIKDSRIGHEGGPTSLDGYLITRTVLQRTVRV